MKIQRTSNVRSVALFEAAKGVLVLLTGVGAVAFVHHDAQRVAEELVTHLHLNPAKHYPRIFIDAAAQLTDLRLWALSAMAALYSAVRLVEAYGLWFARRWGIWMATLSGGIYVPFEVVELIRTHTLISLVALALNLLIVGLMVKELLNRRSSP